MNTIALKSPARLLSGAMYVASIAFAGVIIALLVLVAGYLAYIGFSSVNWAFFSQLPSGRADAPGGMLHAIVGTCILIAMASSIGIPVGMLAGVYLSEYSSNSRLAHVTRFVADVLAGVPSIVVGILGYEFGVVQACHFSEWLTTRLQYYKIIRADHLPWWAITTFNGWAGAFALSFIMIPIVTRTTEEMLRLVPRSYREASIAMGATKSGTILRVVLPSATGSLVTGVMLAIARVAGETAPLLFTALGSRFLETNPTRPFPSLTVQIFTYATGPYPEQKKLAWAGILVLIALIFVLNLTIRFFASRTRGAGVK